MNFNSAKEALLHYGKIDKITRGRISSANHEFLAEKIASGDTVAGYEPATVMKDTSVVFKNATAPVSTDKIVSEYTLIRPLDTKAHAFHNGKKVNVSMREICRHDGVSLVQCTCGMPEVVNHSGTGTMRVYIEDHA